MNPFKLFNARNRLYKKNKKIFNDKLLQLREFQTEAYKSTEGEQKGQIFLPTGTGKTLIQLAIHVNDMIEKSKNGKRGIYIIAAHRLVLCNQLFQDFKKFINNLDINVSYLYISSDEESDDYVTTTEDYKIYESCIESFEKNEHLLIVCTYNSFSKLSIFDNIDICTYDEAHKSVRTDFIKSIPDIQSKIMRNYFFTATQKELDNETLNSSIYGKILYTLSPAEAIKEKEIVPPRIHKIVVEGSEENEDIKTNFAMLSKVIISSFLEHQTVINETSKGMIGAKILISTAGLSQVHPFNKDLDFKNWCMSNEINYFSFSSNEGEYYNFTNTNRKKALEKLRSLDDKENAIIFHYNIISEGIDVPNLTACMFLNNRNEIGFTQITGRACRLLKQDRDKFYISGDTNFIKPECWVLIPKFKGVDQNLLSELTKLLKETYNVISEKVSLSSKISPDDLHGNSRQKKLEAGKDDQELKHILEMFIKSLQDEFDENIKTEDDLIKLINQVYKDDYEQHIFIEGMETRLDEVKYFKRNPKAREECLDEYGYYCFVCCKNLEKIYGSVAEHIIEVHHEKELKEGERITDPIKDLKPVCPDCHTIIHTRRNPCYTIEEIQEKIS